LLSLLALGSATACAVVFSACGGDDTNTGDSGGNDATTNDVATDTTPPNDTGGGDTGNDGGITDGSAGDTGCAPGPNCQACCVTNNPDGAAVFLAAEQACGCTTPGLCNTNQTCKNNFCSNQAPTANCTACLNDKDSGDCRTVAATACIQNAVCQPLAQCVAACGTITDAGGGG